MQNVQGSMQLELPRYSIGEEIANSITHGLGIVLAIAGLAVLTAFASVFGTAWHIVSCSIYGVTLILLYTASTLYHSIPFPRAKAILRFLDHSAIYVFIAGTYTPFALVTLRGIWGWALCAAIWGLAVLGIALQRVMMRQRAIVIAIPYVVMGWLAIIGLKALIQVVPPGALVLLLGGGIAYTVGVLFFIWRRLPFHHAIWHLFVMAGSGLHFFAILLYVIPLAG